MLVIHLISGLFFGGGQKVVLDLLSRPENGIEERLVLLGSQTDSPLSSRFLFVVPYGGDYSRLSTLISSATRLRRMLKCEKPAILHTHGLDADLIGGLALLGSRVKHVAHLHITPAADRKWSSKTVVRRKMLQWICQANRTAFIAVSEAVRNEMADYYGFPMERIRTIRNGVNPASYAGDCSGERKLESDALVVGSAGRLAPMKGFVDLIDAITILHSEGKRIQLKIAGTGSQLEELRQRATSNGVESVVEFVGNVKDMQAFYKSIDVFTLASVSTEGLPLVVLEAMCAGLPVIATSIGGAKEAVRDGVDGKIVPPQNPYALAKALECLVQSAELRARMGASARQRIEEEFSLARVKSEVRRLYEELVRT